MPQTNIQRIKERFADLELHDSALIRFWSEPRDRPQGDNIHFELRLAEPTLGVTGPNARLTFVGCAMAIIAIDFWAHDFFWRHIIYAVVSETIPPEIANSLGRSPDRAAEQDFGEFLSFSLQLRSGDWCRFLARDFELSETQSA